MKKTQEINRNLDVKIMEFSVYVLLGTSKGIAVFFWRGGRGLSLKKKKLNLGSLQHNCNCAYGFADCIGRALKGSHEISKIQLKWHTRNK